MFPKKSEMRTDVLILIRDTAHEAMVLGGSGVVLEVDGRCAGLHLPR
jgi:hypothetical protein